MKYRKKPVEVEAELIADPDDLQRVCDWITRNGGTASLRPRLATPGKVIAISTLEGLTSARVGDYVIRGVAGEFYPCKPDIFTQTYEPAESAVKNVWGG